MNDIQYMGIKAEMGDIMDRLGELQEIQYPKYIVYPEIEHPFYEEERKLVRRFYELREYEFALQKPRDLTIQDRLYEIATDTKITSIQERIRNMVAHGK